MARMMKTHVILILGLVLLSCLAVFASQSTYGPDECCFKMFNEVLPKKKVVNYRWINGQCTRSAVIFTMKNGNDFCVSPSKDWVQKIIKIVDQKKQAARKQTDE